jgi:hypothetical protein
MAYELRNNSGAAFKNRRKTEDNHPDFTGDIMVDNKVYWLNVKSRETKNGEQWMSVWISEKKNQTKPAIEQTSSKPAPQQIDLDDSIPF